MSCTFKFLLVLLTKRFFHLLLTWNLNQSEILRQETDRFDECVCMTFRAFNFIIAVQSIAARLAECVATKDQKTGSIEFLIELSFAMRAVHYYWLTELLIWILLILMVGYNNLYLLYYVNFQQISNSQTLQIAISSDE